MEIEAEPTFQHVTWVIQDFFELPQKDKFFLEGPEFLFGGNTYCIRLYPKVNKDKTTFHVRRRSVNFPERKVSCKIGLRCREANGDECYEYEPRSIEENISYIRSSIEENRDDCVPDGILTVVCCMMPSEESTAGSSAQGEEEQGGFPGQNVAFSSRWKSEKMELSTDSPCTRVQLTVRNVFELLRETGDSLASPEFRFAGDAYCIRFEANGDTEDTDLRLVRLTSNFTENAVYYRVGYLLNSCHTYSHNSRSLVDNVGFCVSRSELEEEKNQYVSNDDLELVLFLRLGEQNSTGAGTSDAAQTQNGLTSLYKLQSDYRQLLRKGTVSDACLVVRGKKFKVHRAVLCARSTFFAAIFTHDTAEKKSGRVVINDLDPEIFGVFLEHLYTGDVQDKLSEDNVFRLYAAADKYDVSTLKSECVEHMRRTLCVNSFCNVVSLALRLHEKDLLQQASTFFKDNLQLIIVTLKWQQFARDNGTAANELFIKALVPGKQ